MDSFSNQITKELFLKIGATPVSKLSSIEFAAPV